MAGDKGEDAGRRVSWARRLGWLLAIWAASVTCLWLLAWLLRQFMAAAGLATPG